MTLTTLPRDVTPTVNILRKWTDFRGKPKVEELLLINHVFSNEAQLEPRTQTRNVLNQVGRCRDFVLNYSLRAEYVNYMNEGASGVLVATIN